MAATKKESNACSFIFSDISIFYSPTTRGLGSILLFIFVCVPNLNLSIKGGLIHGLQIDHTETAYMCFINSGKRSIEIEFILWLAI